MTAESPSRDETTVEVMFLLLAAIAPVLLTIVFEVAMWLLFGLDSERWHKVGNGLLVLSAIGGAATAIDLNRRFRKGHPEPEVSR